jgi:hypothetical protein
MWHRKPEPKRRELASDLAASLGGKLPLGSGPSTIQPIRHCQPFRPFADSDQIRLSQSKTLATAKSTLSERPFARRSERLGARGNRKEVGLAALRRSLRRQAPQNELAKGEASREFRSVALLLSQLRNCEVRPTAHRKTRRPKPEKHHRPS